MVIALRGRIMGKEYHAILQEQVHPMVQALFNHNVPIFQNDNKHQEEVRLLLWSPQ